MSAPNLRNCTAPTKARMPPTRTLTIVTIGKAPTPASYMQDSRSAPRIRTRPRKAAPERRIVSPTSAVTSCPPAQPRSRERPTRLARPARGGVGASATVAAVKASRRSAAGGNPDSSSVGPVPAMTWRSPRTKTRIALSQRFSAVVSKAMTVTAGSRARRASTIRSAAPGSAPVSRRAIQSPVRWMVRHAASIRAVHPRPANGSAVIAASRSGWDGSKCRMVSASAYPLSVPD